jgi:hypothetical protein
MGETGSIAEVEAILRNPAAFGDDAYIFASERHEDLAHALGLPLFSVGLGFNYVREGDAPEGLDLGDLIHAP